MKFFFKPKLLSSSVYYIFLISYNQISKRKFEYTRPWRDVSSNFEIRRSTLQTRSHSMHIITAAANEHSLPFAIHLRAAAFLFFSPFTFFHFISRTVNSFRIKSRGSYRPREPPFVSLVILIAACFHELRRGIFYQQRRYSQWFWIIRGGPRRICWTSEEFRSYCPSPETSQTVFPAFVFIRAISTVRRK